MVEADQIGSQTVTLDDDDYDDAYADQGYINARPPRTILSTQLGPGRHPVCGEGLRPGRRGVRGGVRHGRRGVWSMRSTPSPARSRRWTPEYQDYDDTDYGPNADGVTDYDDTDYGPMPTASPTTTTPTTAPMPTASPTTTTPTTVPTPTASLTTTIPTTAPTPMV